MTLRMERNGLSASQWQKALMQAEFAALQQDWGYGEAARNLGASIERLAIYDGDALIGLAQLSCKRMARLLPLRLCMRGPVWLPAAAACRKSAIYALLRKELPRFTLWMPEADSDAVALQEAGLSRVMTGYHTVLLDLTQPAEALRVQLGGKWRNRLKAAESCKLQVRELAEPEDYRWLLEQEAAQRVRRRYAALPPALVPAYQFQHGRGGVLALAACAQGEPVAGLLCLLHGGHATYHIGWSSEAGKAKSAHNLLLWQAMRRLQARGVRRFDLGGVMTDSAPGLARFKLGTGGKVQSLPGTYF